MSNDGRPARDYVILVFSLAVLLLIPLWFALGVFETEEAGDDGHGGMPGMGGMGVSVEEFMQRTEAFVEEYERPDGCIEPPTTSEMMEENPVVYIQATQFAYSPAKLCLKSGVTYTFRMMAIDVIHGASIQFGSGSLMVRLPPGVQVEQELTFSKAACQLTSCLLYCTFYCGAGHQVMSGQIIVE